MTRDYSFHDDVREDEDVLPARAISGVTVGVVVSVILLCVVTRLILSARESELRPSGRFPEEAFGPPREHAGVRPDLFGAADARAPQPVEQRRLLDQWGWVDRDRRIVRMPIERAIDVVAGEAK